MNEYRKWLKRLSDAELNDEFDSVSNSEIRADWFVTIQYEQLRQIELEQKERDQAS